MIFYWVLFFLPIYIFYTQGGVWASATNKSWRSFSTFLILIIGLRYQVGGDWPSYLEFLIRVKSSPLEDTILEKYEISYNLLNWLSATMGADIYGVNFVCAIIFVGGLTRLSRAQPHPWLAIIVAVPYLIIVVAMGYTRQAAAIGLLMYGFMYLLQGRLLMYLALVVIATTFHKPSIIFIAFSFFRPGGKILLQGLGVIVLLVLGAGAFIIEEAENYYKHYVEENMDSTGGPVRVLMNLLPVFILVGYWKKWGELFKDRWLWALIALLAIACVPLVFYASTAVDRMALYLIPLQLVVWSRYPALIKGRNNRKLTAQIIIIFYAMVLFVWVFYGTFSCHWIPYDNLLFPPLPFERDTACYQ